MDRRVRLVRRWLAGFSIVVALSCAAGAWGLLSALDGSNMGWTIDILEGSPFDDFLVPGLVLLLGVGGAWVVGAVALLRNWRLAPYLAFAAGAIQGGWIVIQIAIINEFNWLHAVYLVVAAIAMASALVLWYAGRGRAHQMRFARRHA